MSEWGKVPREVFLDDRLTRRDLRVLGILCTHADGKTGICTRKQEAIAEEIGADRSGVNRSIGKLVKLGYVATHQRAGMKRSLQYRVLVRDTVGGQMSLFDVRDAPRQAKPRPPKRAENGTSVVPSESTSVVPSSGTSNKQTLVNRSYAASRATPANDQLPEQPPEPVPTRTGSEAPGAVPVSSEFLDVLEDRLRRAAGEAINTAHPAFMNLSEPLGWLADGCDLETDVLPVITGLCARPRGSPIRTWSYFAAAVREARDKKLTAVSTGPPADHAMTGTVIPFDPRGARHEQPSRAAPEPAGRFAAAFARRRRQFAGDGTGGADDPD